jgi:hypothetical protein
MFINFVFESSTVYEIMWKNTVESEKSQIACSLNAGCMWLQTNTRVCNTYCFSTATVAA